MIATLAAQLHSVHCPLGTYCKQWTMKNLASRQLSLQCDRVLILRQIEWQVAGFSLSYLLCLSSGAGTPLAPFSNSALRFSKLAACCFRCCSKPLSCSFNSRLRDMIREGFISLMRADFSKSRMSLNARSPTVFYWFGHTRCRSNINGRLPASGRQVHKPELDAILTVWHLAA